MTTTGFAGGCVFAQKVNDKANHSEDADRAKSDADVAPILEQLDGGDFFLTFEK